MRAWLVFMQLTRDLFAIAKFLLSYAADKQTDRQTDRQTDKQTNKQTDGLTKIALDSAVFHSPRITPLL